MIHDAIHVLIMNCTRLVLWISSHICIYQKNILDITKMLQCLILKACIQHVYSHVYEYNEILICDTVREHLLLWNCLRPKPLSHTTNIKQKIEDIKGVIRSRNRKKTQPMKWWKEKEQRDKQKTTRHCIQYTDINDRNHIHAMQWLFKIITERYILHVQLLLEYYTDISCLERVFVKNTSREKISRAESWGKVSLKTV